LTGGKAGAAGESVAEPPRSRNAFKLATRTALSLKVPARQHNSKQEGAGAAARRGSTTASSNAREAKAGPRAAAAGRTE
jgi:hypothetical protein